MQNLILLTLLPLICLTGCQDRLPDTPQSYLALGDSYTIGESVPETERWPVLLTASLRSMGQNIADPRIVARTGWTTSELSAAIEQAQISDTFELVSLLIGVNNQYRRYPIARYETEFTQLLETALAFAGGRKERVFVLSIPDYGVTPFGQQRNPAQIATELDQYNQVARTICASYEVAFYDITPISREALSDSSLIADDGLHPSGKMYARWVSLIEKEVKKQLR
ncbi:MAG: SGNH/GDSL hydrolase family protein [Bacteroidetes bacterium]|nr:MAG: SGNH/GDSL hydrolase family protein [Bacteroidota bacterium]